MESSNASLTDEYRIARAPLNYRRGMHFFKLAVEQIRIFDPETAQGIREHYIEPLQHIFEVKLDRIPWESMNSDEKLYESIQESLGAREWEKICDEENLTPGPPGFGLRELGLKEADTKSSLSGYEAGTSPKLSSGLTHRFKNPWGLSNTYKSTVSTSIRGMQYTQNTLPTDFEKNNADGTTWGVSEAHQTRDFGPIGPAKPSAVLAARQAREVASTSSSTNDLYDSVTLLSRLSRLNRDKPVGRASANVPTGPAALQQSSDSGLKEALAAYASGNTEAMGRGAMVLDRHGDNEHAGRPSNGERTAASDSGYMSQSDSFYSADAELLQPSRLQHIPSADYEKAGDSRQESEWRAPRAAHAPTSSWAKIAAIEPNSSGLGFANGANPHITLTLASPPTRLPVAAAAARPPSEPLSEQMRVVWLSHLPPKYRTRDVSEHITEGPVMSILLQTDAHETLPGLSACIIFMCAEHAAQFLANNNFSTTANKQTGPTKYAKDIAARAAAAAADASPGKQVGAAAKRTLVKQASSISSPDQPTDIAIFAGAPYPADSALATMSHPTNARRRVKWSRARLFYDVSLRQFKRDVLHLVGGPANVEFFHFYNPGECTVVFSSVSVAAACVEGFAAWRREQQKKGVGAGSANVTTLEEEGRGGGTGEGRLDGKKGRYEGVEVGFVRDFNEAPPGALWSQYGRDGRLRASSRAEGCEGIFEGPDVA